MECCFVYSRKGIGPKRIQILSILSIPFPESTNGTFFLFYSRAGTLYQVHILRRPVTSVVFIVEPDLPHKLQLCLLALIFKFHGTNY